MATGDLITYPQFKLGKLKGTTNIAGLDLTDGNLKVAVLKDTFNPATNFTAIQFMNHASIVLTTFEVAKNTAYTGPITLLSPTAVLNASDIPELRADDYTIAKDTGGFTDGRYLVFFYDTGTPATSAVVAYGDLGAVKAITTSSLQLDWSNVGDAVNTILRW